MQIAFLWSARRRMSVKWLLLACQRGFASVLRAASTCAKSRISNRIDGLHTVFAHERQALIMSAAMRSLLAGLRPGSQRNAAQTQMLSQRFFVAARARVAVSRWNPRCFASARSNTLTLVAVNDVYDLGHLPKLRTLVDAVKAERAGGTVITTLAGDFLSPSVLSSLDRGRGMVGAVRESKAPSCGKSRRPPHAIFISPYTGPGAQRRGHRLRLPREPRGRRSRCPRR